MNVTILPTRVRLTKSLPSWPMESLEKHPKFLRALLLAPPSHSRSRQFVKSQLLCIFACKGWRRGGGGRWPGGDAEQTSSSQKLNPRGKCCAPWRSWYIEPWKNTPGRFLLCQICSNVICLQSGSVQNRCLVMWSSSFWNASAPTEWNLCNVVQNFILTMGYCDPE